ncbi:quinoprotein dehydrogenase-associated SoxYZ-like carrier [uncultured Paracoccus sp.]|uniref:quinoprotein dehydrogenase-associated SoxYZ-like carrier n=1 Tax=uncultured Paracoccus sp. TaxID=189685 RepID=UPI0025EAC3CF|nr:quinoprotein dehydrogenase-associated SoxYZ-like carrier [uncultured Paracoccus sp.]
MTAILSHLLPGGRDGLAAFGGGLTRPETLDSGMWDSHRADLLGAPDAWRSDPGLRLLAPANAEDARHVPILADATGLPAVERIAVTIDYSPFPLALVFHPGRALPMLGFGVKYEIAGPIRVSALSDGAWIMAGTFIDAMGGGCSAPAATHARPDWQDGFGEMRARLWPDTGRLRVAIRHPMDTGLAQGIPAHHLSELILRDAQGTDIARLEIHEPLEENPVLTFLLPPDLARGPISVSARDTSGFRFAGEVSA